LENNWLFPGKGGFHAKAQRPQRKKLNRKDRKENAYFFAAFALLLCAFA
jgi:hypothetical protein